MTIENWHHEFNPSKFLSKVNLSQLIERNKAYNENITKNSKESCFVCKKYYAIGIILNNGLFLCQPCYEAISIISYPEEYERLRRAFLVNTKAREIAWNLFKDAYEYKDTGDSALVPLGWASTALGFVDPSFLVLSSLSLLTGYKRDKENKIKQELWLSRKKEWELRNPEPLQPKIKHFHDPSVILTNTDKLILSVFNHWPGYPPFWKYLREVVLNRDSNRCQVTGCPSRLTLHIHHMLPISQGGSHEPNNLVSLCDFHHALEPDSGHEKIWDRIKTRYFSLIPNHERSNRINEGTHIVKLHLRRRELITLDELRELKIFYGFCCKTCGETRISFSLFLDKNRIRVECPKCFNYIEGAQQLAEETGPKLAEILNPTKHIGKWKARWDMLAERKKDAWGEWSSQFVSDKRKTYAKKVEIHKSTPICPKCGSPMRIVCPRQIDKWNAFWGCSQFAITGCKGSKEIDNDYSA